MTFILSFVLKVQDSGMCTKPHDRQDEKGTFGINVFKIYFLYVLQHFEKSLGI